MSLELDVASRAITATREGLAAAGYAIDVDERDGHLVFRVRAEEGACEECLVPRPIFMTILQDELAEAGVKAESFDLLYPLDGDSSLM